MSLDFLNPKSIEYFVGVRNYRIGAQHYKSGNILCWQDERPHMPIHSEHEWLSSFTGIVSDSSVSEQFSCSVDFFRFGNKFSANTRCDCYEDKCPHIAATLVYCMFEYKSSTLQFDSYELDEWISLFQNEKGSEEQSANLSGDNGFIIFRLFHDVGKNRRSRCDLTVHESRYLKSGKIAKGSGPINLEHFYEYDNTDDLYGEPIINVSEDDDVNIISCYKPIYFDKDRPGEIRGALGYYVIEKLVKTGKVFIGGSKTPAAFSSDLYVPQFFWKKRDGDFYQLESTLKNNPGEVSNESDALILETSPPVIINLLNDNIQHLDPSLNVSELNNLIKAPAIPQDKIPEIHRTLTDNLSLSIKPPDCLRKKTVSESLVPVLLIIEAVNDDGTMDRSLHLQFKYGRHVIERYPVEATSVLYFYNLPNEVNRDLLAEQSAIRAISSLGFVSGNVGNKLFFDDSSRIKKQEKLQLWRKFLDTDIDSLRSEGWEIVFQKGLKMDFAPSSDLVVDCNKVNDWFSLSFEFEVNGKKRSLAPFVSQIIEDIDSFDNPPQEVFVEVDPGKFVPVKTKNLLPVIEVIRQLFDLKQKDGSIKVNTNNAHLLANLNENVPWKGSKELIELGKKIQNYDGLKPVKKPRSLMADVRPYQQEGVNWLNFLNDMSLNGILADDMGLGKSLQTIYLLEHLKKQNKLTGPSLIVVPTTLVSNWTNEIKKFSKSLSSLELYGTARSSLFNKIKNHDIVITTYRLIASDLEIHKKADYDYIIIDEAQNIKNPKTKSATSLCSIPSQHRLALSGTPIENHLGELWSLFHFLMPGFLHTLPVFRKHFQNPIEKGEDPERHQQLKKRIKPFILRRLKSDVLQDLPEKNEIVKYISFDNKQARFYESIRLSVDKNITEVVASKGLANSHMHILSAITKLRLACCHPPLVKIDAAKSIKESTKLNYLLQMLDELAQEGRRVLVFSFFQSLLHVVSEKLEKLGIKHGLIVGETPKKNRDKILNNFKSRQFDVFLGSLKAMGTGLNLTEADTVIHYEPWWNPAVEDQATDRVYRIGQENNVFVYKLICENTIEELILNHQKKKIKLQNSIYHDGVSGSNDSFSPEELLAFLQPIKKSD